MNSCARILYRYLEDIESIFLFIERRGVDSIIEFVSKAISIAPEELAAYPGGGYSRVINDDGSFSKGNGCYFFVLQDLRRNLDEYKHVYSRLCDDISREVFLNQLRYRILPHRDYIKAAYLLSSKYSQYFDEDILKLGEGEVFADCGGYIGDTSLEFIKRCNNYSRIYIYEPLSENAEKCRANLASCDNIVLRQAGVGEKSSSIAFDGGGSSGSFAQVKNKEEENLLDIVSLDEDIKERVTFIKMDIECFEPAAIRGAAGHIKNNSPSLAICLYHMVSDLWEIPKLIEDINPGYDYYLRHYDKNQNWEYVLYAIANSDRAAALR